MGNEDSSERTHRALYVVVFGAAFLALALGYFTQPIPCEAPGQTGCGYDITHMGVILLLVGVVSWLISVPQEWPTNE